MDELELEEQFATDVVRIAERIAAGETVGEPLPQSGVPTQSAGGGTYIYITTFLELVNWMRVFHRPGVEHMLCVDTETTGLNAAKDKLLLLQLHAPGTPCLIIDCRAIPLTVVADTVRDLLTSTDWLHVGHNLGFDYGIIKAHLGIDLERLYDTMLVERLLTAGLYADCGLGMVAERYLGRHLDKAVRNEFIGMAPDHQFTARQLSYASEDVEVLPGIVRAQQARLREHAILDLAKLEFGILPSLAEAHVWGVLIDQAKWREFIIQVAARAKVVEENLVEALTPPLTAWRNKHEAELIPEYERLTAERAALVAYREAMGHKAKEAALAAGKTGKEAQAIFNATKKVIDLPPIPKKPEAGTGPINLGAPEQVGRALVEMEVPLPVNENGRPTTKKEVMLALVETGEYPIVDDFMDWREMNKLVTTYGPIVDLVDDLGRLHAFFNQLVSTGRMSCSGPNLQQVPKTELGKTLRECFIAPPGHKLVSCDYSAVEMVILAEVTGEPLLRWTIGHGLDPHSMTALKMFREIREHFELSDEQVDRLLTEARENPDALAFLKDLLGKIKEEFASLRSVAKMINFGVAYGLSPMGLSKKLRIPLEFAKQYITDYFVANPYIDRWLKEHGQHTLDTLVSRTILGRPRFFRLPNRNDFKEAWQYNSALKRIRRQGCNHVIQGTSADITKLAVLLLRQAFIDGGWDAKMLLFVHDEIVVQVRDDQAEAVAALVKEKMLEAARRIIKVVPVKAEVETGTHWIH